MLLAFDTATQTASLAIYDLENDQLLSEWTWQAKRRQTQELLATATLMLHQLELNPSQLTALAVTTGPGSFTGVRIGISAAKGIGLGLPKPPRVIGLPTLSVTAAPWFDVLRLPVALPNQQSRNAPLLCPYLQAGRGRYNWAVVPQNDGQGTTYNPSLGLWVPTVADHDSGTVDLFLDTFADTSSPVWLVGEVTQELSTAVSALPNVVLIDSVSSSRRAGQLARLAAIHFSSKNSALAESETLGTLQPLYLRQP